MRRNSQAFGIVTFGPARSKKFSRTPVLLEVKKMARPGHMVVWRYRPDEREVIFFDVQCRGRILG